MFQRRIIIVNPRIVARVTAEIKNIRSNEVDCFSVICSVSLSSSEVFDGCSPEMHSSVVSGLFVLMVQFLLSAHVLVF